MKPLTATDLQSILDTELVWRRREISSLVTAIGASDGATKVTLVRSGVPLLYAHWEGFGRVCFQRYLEHVSLKGHRLRDLTASFLYLISLGRIYEISRSSPKIGVQLLPDILQSLDNVNRNPFKKVIDTKSNLRFEVLEGLCAMCGLDPSVFDDDKLFINTEICDPRNEIAHGVYSAPTLADFLKRREGAFSLMSKLQTHVVNAAVEKAFLL